MAFSEAIKRVNCNIHCPEKINGSFISISWEFYETTVGSVDNSLPFYFFTLNERFRGEDDYPLMNAHK